MYDANLLTLNTGEIEYNSTEIVSNATEYCQSRFFKNHQNT